MNSGASRLHTLLRSFFPDLSEILFITVFGLAIASGAQMLSLDSDLGRHLALGDYILNHRTIPTRDIFSHTLAGESRPPYEWLSQVLFALAHRLLELDGVILLTALVLATTFACVFHFAARRSDSAVLAFAITILAIAASSIHWLPRPHILTFLFLAVWVEYLERLRTGTPVQGFTGPLIMLLWANLHGGFIFGVLAWLAYVAGWIWETWRKNAQGQLGQRLLAVGALSLAASVITPDLWRNWAAVLNNRSSFILSRTVETTPLDLTTPTALPFVLILLLSVVLFLMHHRTVPASHVFLLGGLGVLALLTARTIPLFAIVSVPILSALARSSLRGQDLWTQMETRFSAFGREPRAHLLVVIVIVLTVAGFTKHYLAQGQTVFHFNPDVFPVRAIQWLQSNPQSGKMFNEFNWGGYILYRMWPEQQVFLDSQSDFYGESLMREYDQIVSARGNWESVLEKYQVNWAIIPADTPLGQGMIARGWKPAYRDQTTLILLSTGPPRHSMLP